MRDEYRCEFDNVKCPTLRLLAERLIADNSRAVSDVLTDIVLISVKVKFSLISGLFFALNIELFI